MSQRFARSAATLLLLAAIPGCSGFQSDVPQASFSRASGSSGALAGRAPVIVEFSNGLKRGNLPYALTLGPDGAMWICESTPTDSGPARLVRIAQDGTVLGSFAYGQGSFPQLSSIAAGPDGALWFTDYDDGIIGRMTTTGKLRTFNVPGVNGYPAAITAGPDGALWFTVPDQSTIDRIDTAGKITSFAKGITGDPDGITQGPDGALWFTEPSASKIGRMTTAGAATEFPSGASPTSIAAGPDGALWFTEYKSIGRITVNGNVTQYRQGLKSTQLPQAIVAGADGAMWFTDQRQAELGRISMSGTISQYGKGITPRSEPSAIAAGANGTIWFTELAQNRVARATL
ncbi:MAG TPA: hypothetical protein VFA29_01315 [Candidatus Baltobacteraceae bacterium]|nr:hypothetical protein [Candidatus Baltobacteraceae bacterium]